MENYKTAQDKLPKISQLDPIVKKLEAQKGDLLEIKRKSEVSGESIYYRTVV